MVSSTLGSSTSTFWKRRSSAASFFDVLAIFIQRGGADAMQFAAREGRLEHIAGVHGAFRFTRTHQRVDFIDKDDGAAFVLGQFAQHGFRRSSNSPRYLAPAARTPDRAPARVCA